MLQRQLEDQSQLEEEWPSQDWWDPDLVHLLNFLNNHRNEDLQNLYRYIIHFIPIGFQARKQINEPIHNSQQKPPNK